MIDEIKRAPRVRDYLVMLRNGWVVLLSTAVLSGLLGWFTWTYVNPQYTSTATFMAVAPGGATPIDAFYGDFTAKSKVLTYLMLAKDRRVTGRTVDQLQLSGSADDLAAQVKIAPSSTALFDVTVSSGNPDQAYAVATVLGHNLVELSKQMASVDKSTTEVVQIDRPGKPQKTGSLKRSLALSIGIGLAVAVILVIGRALIEDRLVRPRQIGNIVKTEMQGK